METIKGCDKVDELPEGFKVIASTDNAPIAGIANEKRRIYGLQFHPEVTHTLQGSVILDRFLHEIVGCGSSWTMENIIDESIDSIREKVGKDKVLLALSGGVDSSVVAALLHKAIGDQLSCVFVDNGLLRLNEAEQVMQTFAENNVDTGKRHRRSEVSTIDSALLMAGILHAMTYFKGTEVEDLAKEIYKNAQWDKFTNRRGAITGGWKPPEENWTNPEYKGFNEYSLVYLIGLGSPTHPLPESSWDAYSSGNGFEWIKPYRDIGAFMTPKGVMQPHAYLYQFPACWYDFRNKKDNYANYWEVSVNALKANQRYTQNWGSMVGYSEELWGWTACAGPRGYIGFSKPYNGTLAPSAVIASLPFLPEESLKSAKYMYKNYGDKIWGKYGFVDSFNPHQDWYADGFIGIDKGNEVLMIENFRNGGVWKVFMQNPFVQKGLEKAKFSLAN